MYPRINRVLFPTSPEGAVRRNKRLCDSTGVHCRIRKRITIPNYTGNILEKWHFNIKGGRKQGGRTRAAPGVATRGAAGPMAPVDPASGCRSGTRPCVDRVITSRAFDLARENSLLGLSPRALVFLFIREEEGVGEGGRTRKARFPAAAAWIFIFTPRSVFDQHPTGLCLCGAFGIVDLSELLKIREVVEGLQQPW